MPLGVVYITNVIVDFVSGRLSFSLLTQNSTRVKYVNQALNLLAGSTFPRMVKNNQKTLDGRKVRTFSLPDQNTR